MAEEDSGLTQLRSSTFWCGGSGVTQVALTILNSVPLSMEDLEASIDLLELERWLSH